MDASPCLPVAAYASINALPGRKPGCITFAGTSVAAALSAGMAADATQIAGHPPASWVPPCTRCTARAALLRAQVEEERGHAERGAEDHPGGDVPATPPLAGARDAGWVGGRPWRRHGPHAGDQDLTFLAGDARRCARSGIPYCAVLTRTTECCIRCNSAPLAPGRGLLAHIVMLNCAARACQRPPVIIDLSRSRGATTSNSITLCD